MPHTQRPSRSAIIVAFGLVYFFWGSTYLGIDIAIEHIPPALLCAVRFLMAGGLMLAYCALSGRKVFYGTRQMWLMAVCGVLLLVGGNLGLSYAELYVPSGLAALIIAVTPLWFLILDTLLLGDHRIDVRGKIGLALGAAGLVVLLWPDLTSTGTLGRAPLWASVMLLFASFSWALGSVLSKRWKSPEVDLYSAMGWQMTAAGFGNLLIAIAAGNLFQATWTVRGISAVLYLVTCGSLVGYTAFIWLLNHVPTSKVSTYAYVNPVVAVFLGWLVLHERVDRYILAGSAIVIASVVLVTSAHVKTKTVAEEMSAAGTVAD